MRTNVSRYFRHPGMPDVECLRLAGRGECFPLHTHDCFVVGVSRQYEHRFEHRGRRYRVTRDSVALLNPGEAHTGERVGTRWDYRGLHVAVPLIEEIWAETARRDDSRTPHFPAVLVTDGALASRLGRLHHRLASGAESLDVESSAVQVFAQLLRRHARSSNSAGGPAPRREVALACEVLAEAMSDPPGLRDLAATVGLSRFHLLRVFRREIGLTPYAWLTQVRIQRARSLIRAGYSLSVVASRVGFSDQSHFTRVFRRVVGLPPAAWRTAIGGDT